MNKPHIKKANAFMYKCTGEGIEDYGSTEQLAYETWKNIIKLRSKGMHILTQLCAAKPTKPFPILNYGDGVEYQERLREEWE